MLQQVIHLLAGSRILLVPVAGAVVLVAGLAIPRYLLGQSASAWFEAGGAFSYVSPVLLVLCGVASLLLFRRRRRATYRLEPTYLSPALFWLLLALGFPLLATDELLHLHQRFALWLTQAYQASGATPSHHMGELLPGVYVLVGAMLLAFCGGELRYLRCRWPLLLAGASLVTGAVVLNLADDGGGTVLTSYRLLSDLAKIEGEICLATGLFASLECMECEPRAKGEEAQ